MNKERVLSFVLTAVVVFAVSPLAWGVYVPMEFDNPPEDNPNITWETQYPDYQRNIFLDFSVNPLGASGNGIPGAGYYGNDDPVLWDSDYIEFTGAVGWNEELGAVGIFDAEGQAFGTMIIHIDNWIRDYPVKHLYEEVVFQWEQGMAIYQSYLGLPAGYVQDTGNILYEIDTVPDPTTGAYSWQYWTEIEPNPPWEEKVINFGTGAAGGSVYVESVHIATECVPEPTTMALLGLGGLLLRRKK